MHTDYAAVLAAHEMYFVSEKQAYFHPVEVQEPPLHGARHGHQRGTVKAHPCQLPTPYSFARIDGFFQDEGAHEMNQHS
jgi:hypothetical protein